jgi:hypothetical protein
MALSGCHAEAGPGAAYVETAPPVEIDTAPTYSYDGRTVYYVHDRWYTRDHGNWVYYRREPDTLYRYRTRVREAPRARDYHGRQAPPRHEVARPRREAPRAVRVQ